VLLFLILEILSLSMLFTYNKFHEAFFMRASGDVTGKFFTEYTRVHDYFHLKEENDRLARQNLLLLKAQAQNYISRDSAVKVIRDSIPMDSTGRYRKFEWRGADVINNSITFPDNYITLNRGALDSVRKDMGVIGPDGIVGTVVNVSDHVAVVLSLLHKKSLVSGMLKKSRDAGRIIWDGVDPNVLTMMDIPKSVKVAKGDTVITSTYSEIFPSSIPIGTILKIESDPASNFYILKLRSATNFGRLQHVFVVGNSLRQEQVDLEDDTKKKLK